MRTKSITTVGYERSVKVENPRKKRKKRLNSKKNFAL